MLIKDFLKIINCGDFVVEDSIETNSYEIDRYRLMIHIGNEVYESVDDLPYEKASVRYWTFTTSYFKDDCLEVFCYYK